MNRAFETRKYELQFRLQLAYVLWHSYCSDKSQESISRPEYGPRSGNRDPNLPMEYKKGRFHGEWPVSSYQGKGKTGFH
eukprot:6594099-Karenia_brevis.AAC.1